MEAIRERFKQSKSSESVKLRKRSSILYSTERKRHTLQICGISISVFIVIFRLINCFLVQSSFVPDEYWQSLEIAHRMVFGYPCEMNTIILMKRTWEWKEGIRGYSFPLLYALMYKLLQLMNYDTVYLLVLVPQVFQAFLAAFADVKLYQLVLQWESPEVAKWTCLSQLCSWFTWFCCSRTLTNSTETALTTLALYYYPLPGSKTHNSWKYLSLVSLAVVVRPTALIVWFPLLLYHFCIEQEKLKLIAMEIIPIATVALGASSLIDSVFYGKWILVQWRFLKFNVLHSVSEFYGWHPWHWYLSQGLPVVIGPHLPLVLHGFLTSTRKHTLLLLTVVWTTGVYSLLAHKEFRFVYPVLPFCMVFSGMSLSKLQRWRKAAAGALLLFNLIPAFYTGLIHQRGALDVMQHLQTLCEETEAQVLFLMPCHSTPLYSHLHCPLKLRFLECPPDLTGSDGYLDEAELFYSNPLQWLETSFPSKSTLPSHLVLFNSLETEIFSFLEKHRFRKQAQVFHTHFPEGRVGTHILLYARVPDANKS
ncbi:hypothetical protein DNTS_033334 [Danionella cerebrum]|uniref:Mannosyltransferase n=1 Tax=Danionella cerebrum TaxID=2873325 RepID=A0A553QJN4_9TELE|nr:hypothetical protein DNTS_033334 [Danionella translucida]